MAEKNDKWLMFKNYMHNELGITKEDIREWINEAVEIEAKKIVNNTFKRVNPEVLIRKTIIDNDLFGKNFNKTVIDATAKIIADKISICLK